MNHFLKAICLCIFIIFLTSKQNFVCMQKIMFLF